MKKILLFITFLILLSCRKEFGNNASEEDRQAGHLSQKIQRVLYVNSYHKGYKWSDDIERGIHKAFEDPPFPLDLKIIRMETKEIANQHLIQNRAQEVKETIESWNPHIIIGSDDNFARYVVVPFLMESEIPVIFCGINWDAEEYGFPTDNITGIIEIDPFSETVELLQKFTVGTKIGILGYNGISEQKIVKNIGKKLQFYPDTVVLVDDFVTWKKEYLRMQQQVDMLIMLNPVGMRNWNPDEARDFVFNNSKIPTGTADNAALAYAMMGRCKIAEEQGWLAANMALRVLTGTPVSSIEVETNRNSLLYFNMELINKAGFHPSAKLLENAVLWQYDEVAP